MAQVSILRRLIKKSSGLARRRASSSSFGVQIGPGGLDMARSIQTLVMTMLLVPAWGFAQTNAGTIAGTVRDATGAVLPGVTVEASSPALIEKLRAAQT